jgi:hypothetical protein
MNNGWFLLLALGALVVGCKEPMLTTENPINLEVWYGDQQQFGSPGLAQRWINILGNVSSPHGIQDMHYQLNNRAAVRLTLGSDLHRLAAQGDFNVDLDAESCQDGINRLVLEVVDSAGNRLSSEMTFQYSQGNRWPLPYTIRWAEVENIQQVAQIVDGNWEITDEGIHNLDTYYDRVIAFGDTSWHEYEVSTTVIFHDFTPPTKGPPTYNVSHAAIASRWPGHDIDSLQPYRKWYPLGATSEFRLTKDLDSCRWRIFDGNKPGLERFYVEQQVQDYCNIELNKKYGMKHRVETIGPNRTRYSVKLWPYDQPEPEAWDFQGIENDENLPGGSALLLAHNTSVTFGDVSVVSIKN